MNMNSNVAYALCLGIGVAIGSVITWKIIEKKYEKISKEEIDSVKKQFAHLEKKKVELKKQDEENTVFHITPAVVNIENTPSDAKRVIMSYDTASKKKYDAPYVISPEEFGEMYDYAEITLLLYADGVLTDDRNEIIDDINSCVGEDALNHFGEYEEDSVFIRNDARKCDYQILRDVRTYEDIMYHREEDND